MFSYDQLLSTKGQWQSLTEAKLGVGALASDKRRVKAYESLKLLN
jgi:hypothetical protein